MFGSDLFKLPNDVRFHRRVGDARDFFRPVFGVVLGDRGADGFVRDGKSGELSNPTVLSQQISIKKIFAPPISRTAIDSDS